MVEFGEVLTLFIAIVATAYVAANWRRVRQNPRLGPFVWPFLFFTFAWTAAFAEALCRQDTPLQFVILAHETIDLRSAGLVAQVFHLIEHLSYALAAGWLLVAVRRAIRSRHEVTS
jgi:hypothetical protein